MRAKKRWKLSRAWFRPLGFVFIGLMVESFLGLDSRWLWAAGAMGCFVLSMRWDKIAKKLRKRRRKLAQIRGSDASLKPSVSFKDAFQAIRTARDGAVVTGFRLVVLLLILDLIVRCNADSGVLTP